MNAPAPWFSVETIHLMKKWHSEAMNIKPLLLAIPGQGRAVIGWYLGGDLQEWRMEGTNSEQKPTHWMPLPKLPE